MYTINVANEDLVFKVLRRTSDLSKLSLKVVWGPELSNTMMSASLSPNTLISLVFRKSDYLFGV